MTVRHFDFLDEAERLRLFHRVPESFAADGDPDLVAVGLGATLYCPGTRPALAEDLTRRAEHGLVSAVVCLEDSVADADLARAEANAMTQLGLLARGTAAGPLVFVRVRSPSQVDLLLDGLGADHGIVSGFVLPKFDDVVGAEYLEAIAAAGHRRGRRLLAMPVLESAEIIHAETRLETLLALRRLVDKFRDHVLAVRLGATDLSAAYGLRRSRDLTVYDSHVVADVIADIVNVFGRADVGYVVTGPVWEYFSGAVRMFKPQLRETPFVAHDERRLRARLIARDLDGLIREIALDRANGLTGKTVIHPSHVAPVHALSVVTHEEYVDATDVLDTAACGGVSSSTYRNKMNESKPHAAWARRTMLRARVFGVARPDVSFVDLLAAALER
jgi:citrate lyase beta subunit